MKVALLIHSNIFKKVDGMTNYYNRLCADTGASRPRLDVFLQDEERAQSLQKNFVRFFFVKVKSSFQPLPKAFLSLNPAFYIKLAWYFHKKFKKEKYDCVQFSSAHPFCFAAALVAKRLNIPVIGSYHTLLPEYVPYWAHERFQSRLFGKLLTKFLCVFVSIWTPMVYGTADLILAPTSKVKEVLKKKFPRTKIEVIGRGVNSELFRPLKKRNHRLRLLYVGRVSVEKNLEQLSFLGSYDDLDLTIVGDGNDLMRIKQILPFAKFKGALQREKLAREYGCSDVFVFPSITDAYANVVSEALSAGLPVVAFNEAGVEDRVKTGINGFLVSTTEDFETAVLKLKEKSLRSKMSHQARQAALNLNWDSVFERQYNAFTLAISAYHAKLRRFFPIFRKVLYSFNFSHAFLGSLRMGFYIFLANASAGISAGVYSGMRQSLISFLMVGINTSFFEFLYFRNRILSIILPSLFTTTVATSIHFFSGTPNLITTATTIFGLAIFNFTMLSEIHKRHETISPWELIKIFGNYVIGSMKQIKVKVTSHV
ncbi:MAG: glycosyltransferase [Desulfobacterales bacterium]|jgi:glycosyltransferase involved in cell wall biosynthesis